MSREEEYSSRSCVEVQGTTALHAETSVRVRVSAAGWVDADPESGEPRRFRFDCTLIDGSPPWTFEQVWNGEFLLTLSEGSHAAISQATASSDAHLSASPSGSGSQRGGGG